MADNIVLDPGTGGATIAADDISSVWYQRVKLTDGTADSSTVIASGNGTATESLRVTVASDSTGVLSVDDNGGSITVDGTVATTNGGTFAVQEDGAALTALQIIDNPVFADDAAFTLTSSSVMMAGAIRDDALATLTAVEGDAVPLRVTSTGGLWTQDANSAAILTDTGTIAGDTTSIDGKITACNTGAVVISSGTVTTVSTVTNLSQLGGAAISMNTGVRDTGTQRVTIATDDSVPVTSANLTTIAGAVSGTEMQVDVVAALPAGSNLVGDVGLSGARTSGGTTIFRSIDIDETEEEVKGTAGQVYWIHAMNLTAATVFLKFYNATAASVTVGTTTPVLTFALATQGDTNGAGFALSIPNGIAFGTAITVACTTGVADNDTTGPAANGVLVNLGYA